MEKKTLLSEPNTMKPVYELVEIETDYGQKKKGIYIYGLFYEMKHGWYSNKASQTNHTHVYLNQYDNKVSVTTVTSTKKNTSVYKDISYMGTVFKHIGSYKEPPLLKEKN